MGTGKFRWRQALYAHVCSFQNILLRLAPVTILFLLLMLLLLSFSSFISHKKLSMFLGRAASVSACLSCHLLYVYKQTAALLFSHRVSASPLSTSLSFLSLALPHYLLSPLSLPFCAVWREGSTTRRAPWRLMVAARLLYKRLALCATCFLYLLGSEKTLSCIFDNNFNKHLEQ